VAVVELLLLVVLGGGRLAGYVTERVQLAARESVVSTPALVAPAAKKKSPPAVAKRPRSKTVVMVLNGNGRTGAAAAAASRVQSRGYKVGDVTNAPQRVPRSIVMYRPGFAGEGKRLGKDLGVRLVTPLDGMRASGLRGAHVVFVLGP
jgi:hypothetical protein